MKTLLDTGADVSVINRKYLPKNVPISACELKVGSASGQQMKIIGKVGKLK